MHIPRWVSEFLQWRWAPCAGLIAGSLLFVASAIVLIPTHVEPSSAVTESRDRSERLAGAPQGALFGAALVPASMALESATDERNRPRRESPFSTPQEPELTPATRGFSPVRERPQPPLAPPSVAPMPNNESSAGMVATPGPVGPQRELPAR